MKHKRTNSRTTQNNRSAVILGGCAAIVVAGAGGVIAYANHVKNQDLYGTYCKVGDHEVSRVEYEFYYNSSISNIVNSYGSYISMIGLDLTKPLSSQVYDESTGQTWDEYFQQQAYELMKEVFVLGDAALEDEGFVKSSESYDTFYKSVEDYCAQNNMSVSDYLTQVYGANATKKNLEDTLRNYFMANDYVTYLKTEKLIPSDEEVLAYYDSNKDTYDSVTYRSFPFYAEAYDENGDRKSDADVEKAMAEAKKKAEEFYNQVYDEETFKELCVKYSDDSSKEEYKENDASLMTVTGINNAPSAYSSWIFDSNRKKNATAIIEDEVSSTYYVVFFKERKLNEDPTVTSRHILISPDEIEQVNDDYSEEEKEAYNTAVAEAESRAESSIDEIRKLFDAEGGTEDAFAKLADQYSDDRSSAGGLLDCVARGETVAPFDEWIFSKDRKAGDVEKVQTSYGWHLIYWMNEDVPAWKRNARSTMAGEAFSEFVKEASADYPFEDTRGKMSFVAQIAKTEDVKADENSESDAETTDGEKNETSSDK